MKDSPRTFNIQVDDSGNPDESPVYRNNTVNIENGGEFISTFRSLPDAKTTIELLRGATQKFHNHDFLAQRERAPDGKLGKFKFFTYDQTLKKIEQFAAALNTLGFQFGDKLGIYSHSCVEWTLSSYGCQMAGGVTVPVYDSLGPDAAFYIIDHSECKAVVVQASKLEDLLETAKRTPKLKLIIVIGDFSPVEASQELITFNDFLARGESQQDRSFPHVQKEDIAVIMYTSGSTGLPKGCVLTHQNIIAGAAGFSNLGISFTTDDYCLAFLPLAHIYEMCVEMVMINQGVKIGYFSGSIPGLVDDINEFHPTAVVGVPRVYNKLVEGMQAKVNAVTGLTKKIFDFAFQFKKKNFATKTNQSFLLDLLVFEKFRQGFGGRIKFCVSGGAPILPEVIDFLRVALCPNIIQGYGLTECAAGLAVQECGETNYLSVGTVSLCTEWKVRKVEGLSYDPRGERPSGEFLIRGPNVFKEYYREPGLTKAAFQDDWFCTGDIIKLTDTNLIEIVDRVKQLVKLSQGEYLSITHLMDQYETAENVLNIFIFADSHHNYPVAVVVPTKKQIDTWALKGITDPTNSTEAKNDILNGLKLIHSKFKMRGFERIVGVHISLEEFSIQNGLLTPSMKPQLISLRKRFEKELTELLSFVGI